MELADDEKKQLRARIAALESKVDHLEAEFIYLNQILTECGFPNGIATLKGTVEEVLNENMESQFERARRREEEDLL